MTVIKGLVEQLSDSSTALICNALDYLSIQVPYMDGTIRCMSPNFPPLVGEAITIKLDSSTPGGKSSTDAYWRLLEEIDKSSVPRVVVIQTIGVNPYRECVAGDGMAKTFLSVGAIGAVSNGGFRDIKDILNQGFKIFGLASVVSHGTLRWSGLNEPVEVGGINVKPGDLIHGDSDGCIVIPQESYGKITPACRLVLNFEKKAHVVLRQAGISLEQKKLELGEFVKELREGISNIRECDV